MEILETLYIHALDLIKQFSTIQGGLQIAAVLLCATLATLTHKHWQRYITRLVGDFEHKITIPFPQRDVHLLQSPTAM